MDIKISKIIALLLIFIGEAAAIYAEVAAAKTYAAREPFLSAFFKMLALIGLAGGFLIAGYMLGFRFFKNIWTVSVISIVSILIAEPILNYAIFQQLPTKGAVVGLILGALGLASALSF